MKYGDRARFHGEFIHRERPYGAAVEGKGESGRGFVGEKEHPLSLAWGGEFRKADNRCIQAKAFEGVLRCPGYPKWVSV
jgi:hypothetical protein